MFKYSNKSEKELSTTHFLIQKIFDEAIKYVDITILEGHRDEEKQNEYFNKGVSKVKFPNSKHNSNPSMAVDATPHRINFKDLIRLSHFTGFMLGISKPLLENTGCRLISGIDWDADFNIKEHGFLDYPHFQLEIIDKDEYEKYTNSYFSDLVFKSEPLVNPES